LDFCFKKIGKRLFQFIDFNVIKYAAQENFNWHINCSYKQEKLVKKIIKTGGENHKKICLFERSGVIHRSGEKRKRFFHPKKEGK
jgi:hypothetical protein